MKITVSQVALAAALFAPVLAAPAHAESYGALRVGFNDAEASAFGGTVSFNQGMSYEGAIGHDFGALRIEAGVSRDNAELGLVGIEADLTNVSATALLETRGPFGLTYFAGAGVDFSMAEANLGFASIDGEGDGWHFDVGASTMINDRWSIELRRRQYEGDISFDFIGDVSVENTNYTLGILFIYLTPQGPDIESGHEI